MSSSGNIDFTKKLSPVEKKAYQDYKAKVAAGKADKSTPSEERAFLKVQKCKAELLKKKKDWTNYKQASTSVNESISQSREKQRKAIETAGDGAIGVTDFYTFGGVTKFGEASEAAAKRRFAEAGYKFTEGALRTAVGVPMASSVALLSKCGAKALVQGLGYAVKNPKVIGTIIKAAPSVIKAGIKYLPQLTKAGIGKMVQSVKNVKDVLFALRKTKSIKEIGSLAAQTASKAVKALKNPERVIELSSKAGLGDFGLECTGNTVEDLKKGRIGSAALNAAFAAGTLAGLGALKYEHIMMPEAHAQFAKEAAQLYTSAKGAVGSGVKEALTALNKIKEVPSMIAQGAGDIFETAKQFIKNPTQALEQLKEGAKNVFSPSPKLALAGGGEFKINQPLPLRMEGEGLSGSSRSPLKLTQDFSNRTKWYENLSPEERKLADTLIGDSNFLSESHSLHPDSALSHKLKLFEIFRRNLFPGELEGTVSVFGRPKKVIERRCGHFSTLENINPKFVGIEARKSLLSAEIKAAPTSLTGNMSTGDKLDFFLDKVGIDLSEGGFRDKLMEPLEKLVLRVNQDIGRWHTDIEKIVAGSLNRYRMRDLANKAMEAVPAEAVNFNSWKTGGVEQAIRSIDTILRAKTPDGLRAALSGFEFESTVAGADRMMAAYAEESSNGLEQAETLMGALKGLSLDQQFFDILQPLGIKQSTIDSLLSCLPDISDQKTALKGIRNIAKLNSSVLFTPGHSNSIKAKVERYISELLEKNKRWTLSGKVFDKLAELKGSEELKSRLGFILDSLGSNANLLESNMPQILSETDALSLFERVKRLAYESLAREKPEVLLDTGLLKKIKKMIAKMREYEIQVNEDCDELYMLKLPKNLIEEILAAAEKIHTTNELEELRNFIIKMSE